MSDSGKSTLEDSESGRPPRTFWILARVRSFAFAWKGVRWLVRSQHNMWLHLGAGFSVVAGGFFFKVSRAEWAMLVLAITAVWAAEGLNTAVEILCDVVSAAREKRIGQVKDVAAGAVLICAAGAAVIGAIVFWPKVSGG